MKEKSKDRFRRTGISESNMSDLKTTDKKSFIFNQTNIFLFLGINTSWIITFFWYEIAENYINYFGTLNDGKVSTQQTIKKFLFLINFLVLIFIAFKIFNKTKSHSIFKILIILLIIYWLGLILLHSVAFGIIS